MQASPLLRTTLHLLEEARAQLDLFNAVPGKQEMEAAATSAAQLLAAALQHSEAFMGAGRAASTGEVHTRCSAVPSGPDVDVKKRNFRPYSKNAGLRLKRFCLRAKIA